MMGLKLRQFKLLLWKNWILQIRRPIGTVFEILLPLAFTALLLLAKILITTQDKCFTTFETIEPFDINSYTEEYYCDLGLCGNLTYFPQNDLTKALMLTVSGLIGVPLSQNLFISEDAMVTTVADNDHLYYGAVVFDIEETATGLPMDVEYTIRLSHNLAFQETWNTDDTYPPFPQPGPRTDNNYYKRFIAIQSAMDRAILISQSAYFDPVSAASTSFQMQQFPYPGYKSDAFISTIDFLLPLLMVFAFMYSGGIIVKELVIEKETRLKESMKMMGLANWLHWLAWFVKTYSFLLISIILIVILFKAGKVLEHGDGLVIFIFFMTWILASTMWSFMISVFFSKSRLGFIFGLLMWFLSYLPLFILPYDETSGSTKTLCCFLPNSAMGYAMNCILRYESSEEGIQWSNIGRSPATGDSFNLGNCFLMLLLDSFIFFIIMWYVEQVFPGKYGIPQPINFPFKKSYWCGNVVHVSPDDEAQIAMNNIDNKNHESAPNIEVGIDIKNLRKVYKSSVGKKLAVDDLSLKMYKGQITSLLGHNGAGKTTTMSILTGLFPPTSGSATINGKSIVTDIQSVRSSLGLCPQHNVLFDRLTVKEHLDFFINLKGKSGAEANAEVRSMIEDLQLVDKTNTASSSLSGGMKRKLSCAIALIGGSEVVILDEPTSGMDPYARRATWDLLLKYKAGKTMVLTTHFMDEADLLGDRIAIMAHGQLLCSGSSHFLKNRYGVGYHMTLVKNENCQVDQLTKIIQDYVPGSYLESNIGAELAYILPGDSTSQFQSLFENVEAKRTSLGVESFGVSITTLEEVFMKVGEQAEAKANGTANNDEGEGAVASTTMQNIQKAEKAVNISQLETRREDLLSGLALKAQQFKAMYIKRFLNSKRDKKAVIIQFFFPLLFIFLGLLIILLSGGSAATDDPKLELSLIKLNEAEDLNHRAYYADFTGNDAVKIFQNVESYLVSLKFLEESVENIEGTVQTLMNENSYGKVKGEDIPSPMARYCCLYNFIILNEECSSWIRNQPEDACKDYPEYSYTNCPSCYNSTEKLYGSCPVGAQPSILSDPNTYFQESVLEEDADNEPNFFNELVAGFVSVNATFDAQQVVPNLYAIFNNSLIANVSFVKKLEEVNFYELALNVSTGTLVTAWYSNEAYHTSVQVLNAASNMILKSFTSDEYSITTYNYPLPRNVTAQAEEAASSESAFGLSILVVFGMAFLSASFIGFVVGERENKAKHLQFVSGVDPLSYWGATFVWDVCNFAIVFVGIIIMFAAFNLDAYGGSNLGTVALLFLLFGWMAIPFIYSAAFMFKTPVNATALTIFLLAILSMFTILTIFVLSIPGLGLESTANALDYVFCLIPTHCLGRAFSVLGDNDGLRRICTASQEAMINCQMSGYVYQDSNLAWDKPGIGTYCLYMFIGGIVFIILTLLIEVNFFIPSRSASVLKGHVSNPDDSDVADERQKVSELDPKNSDSAVILQNLSKVYRKKPAPAVDQLCLNIPKGQCFGLLGVNGAGKTTTFGMLTGDLSITAGTAYMDGFDIQTQRKLVQQRIGYCPQFDALLERLTGREVLTMFARLRGIPNHNIENVVETTVTHLSLNKWADKLCGDYSGGNKRKLSTGIALVGNPPIVFLDEPTSGMDPTARRYLWNALTSVMKGGRSIVLTSHSMEECEALCTRLAIMVNGQFKCLGSTQHLKSRYGKGYTMVVKMEDGVPMDGIKSFINGTFEGAVLLEEHQGVLQYQVENSDLSWSYIFGKLESNKQELRMEDYSVSQTTLEQVFINFAKEQHTDAAFSRKLNKAHHTTYVEVPSTGANLRRESTRRSLRSGPQSPK